MLSVLRVVWCDMSCTSPVVPLQARGSFEVGEPLTAGGHTVTVAGTDFALLELMPAFLAAVACSSVHTAAFAHMC